MTPAIRFDHVSKKFDLERARARSLQELVVQRRARRQADDGGSDKLFWALRDVSFDLQPGEHLGLVGANGSGKSTLLKLISRVIEPTSGRVETRGRVAGLLELGTGFHPDLTGRENIFLNASILGIPRAEIKRRLDDIIDFADIGPFIDVQVRNYSSGMVVRLGFAITTALSPDILLIDEVLAVGDAAFQRKCFDRLEELRAQDVTLVFVSHSMELVQRLCKRALWIDDGLVQLDGDAAVVGGKYLDAQQPAKMARHAPSSTPDKPAVTARWGSYQAEITRVELLDAAGRQPAIFKTGDFFRLRMHYRAHTRVDTPTFGIAMYRRDNVHVNGPNSVSEGCHIPFIEGEGYVDYVVDHLPLNDGQYELTVAIYNRDSTTAHDHQHRQYKFEVRAPGRWREEGVIHIPAVWQHTPLSAGSAPPTDGTGEDQPTPIGGVAIS